MRALAPVLLAVTVLLSGCAGPVRLSDADDGSVQRLDAGQELQVSLEANPTTGYQWAVDGDLPAQLEQKGEPVYDASSNAIGAGGTEVWTFVAKEPGTGTLRLKYWRSFEPTVPPVVTYSLSVAVR